MCGCLGAEWDALAAFLGSERMKTFLSQGRIQQLLLEFHWDPDSRLIAFAYHMYVCYMLARDYQV